MSSLLHPAGIEEDLSDESEEESEDEDEEEEGDDTWVEWFCSLRGNEFFCVIEDDYIRDNFNLTGLSAMVMSHVVAIFTYSLDKDIC